MKLNVGCGDKRLAGYVNIDVVASRKGQQPDIVADVRKIPLGDACADEVLAVHVFEHFYLWEAVDDVLPEWWRLLRSGGILALEMPDIVKCCRNVVTKYDRGHKIDDMSDVQIVKTGIQIGLWGVYGDPSHRDPYMGHHWGWTYKTLAPVLKGAGFRSIRECDPLFHGKRTQRDFRIEAVKA